MNGKTIGYLEKLAVAVGFKTVASREDHTAEFAAIQQQIANLYEQQADMAATLASIDGKADGLGAMNTKLDMLINGHK